MQTFLTSRPRLIHIYSIRAATPLREVAGADHGAIGLGGPGGAVDTALAITVALPPILDAHVTVPLPEQYAAHNSTVIRASLVASLLMPAPAVGDFPRVLPLELSV